MGSIDGGHYFTGRGARGGAMRNLTCGALRSYESPIRRRTGTLFRYSFWVGRTWEKRWRATAVQNLAEMRSGPVNAKRLGVRQPSGALERSARCLAMTEIKLGRTPHSALSIPHLNGSFPVFILGWTIGTNCPCRGCYKFWHNRLLSKCIGRKNAVETKAGRSVSKRFFFSFFMKRLPVAGSNQLLNLLDPYIPDDFINRR